MATKRGSSKSHQNGAIHENGAAHPVSSNGTPAKPALAFQYGGNHASGWLAYVPQSWLPYVQLARLSPPAGLLLIFYPHAFGILLTGLMTRAPLSRVLESAALLLGGSFFVSNAIHIWNDLVDAPLDAKVERTRQRPIPRGAVSPFAAVIFTLTQTFAAAIFLQWLPQGMTTGFLYSLPSIIAWTYYPYAKKHTNFPQVVLGFCLAWGIFMGSLAMGVEPFPIYVQSSSGENPEVQWSTVYLFLANIIWTINYDTVYAHQDLKDDLKAGIKSLAVLFQDQTKTFLWPLQFMMIGLMVACGWLANLGWPYYLIAVGGSTITLVSMLLNVELSDYTSCWWWYRDGSWYVGWSITGGLLLEYLLSMEYIPDPVGLILGRV